MKKTGRGSAYEKALIKNLAGSLKTHKKIITTVSRAKLLKKKFVRKQGGIIKFSTIGKRYGDNTFQVQVEWQELLKQKNEDKTDKTSSDTKTVASH